MNNLKLVISIGANYACKILIVANPAKLNLIVSHFEKQPGMTRDQKQTAEHEEPTRIDWNDAVSRRVVLTATRIALIVGTLLAIINHGPTLLALEVSGPAWLQIGLTYLVPYGVSTYSSISMLAKQKSDS